MHAWARLGTLALALAGCAADFERLEEVRAGCEFVPSVRLVVDAAGWRLDPTPEIRCR